jgi:hypothetical protein
VSSETAQGGRPPASEGLKAAATTTCAPAADILRDASPWRPITDVVDLKHLGKLAEELNECASAAAFAIIHGVGELVPTFETSTKRGLEQEIADVKANIGLVGARFGIEVFDFDASAASNTQHFIDRILLAGFALRLNNCGSAVARCIIQGIDEREPITGKVNREWLHETIEHVIVTVGLVIKHFGLDREYIALRADKKKLHLQQWHALA